MPVFITPGPIAAILEVAGAQVRVIASDRTDTTVRVEPVNAANRKDVKVAGQTEVGFAAGQLTVKTMVPGDKNGSVAITVELPSGSSLAAHLAFSAVHADGPLGDCELQMASGRVQLDRTGALRASISAGEVQIGHIARRADIDGATFTARIGEVRGPAVIASSGGRARIGHAAADLALTSGSGSLDVDRADGGVTVTTGSGAIRIGRMTHGQAKLINGSGNIEVGISAGAAAHLDVNSERGAVHNTAGTADAPDAEVTVHARTRHGDIVIQRAAAS